MKLTNLFAWMRRTPRPRGATLQPDLELLKRLQAARRALGSRWVLHPSRPRVRWGHGRG